MEFLHESIMQSLYIKPISFSFKQTEGGTTLHKGGLGFPQTVWSGYDLKGDTCKVWSGYDLKGDTRKTFIF